MIRHALRPILAIVVGGILLGACGQSGGVSSKKYVTLSPERIIAISFDNVRHQNSVQVREVSKSDMDLLVRAESIGFDSGRRFTIHGSNSGTIELVDETVYLRSPLALLREQFSQTDAQLANKWISIPHTDANYDRFSAGMILETSASTMYPVGALRVGPVSILNGQRVIAISGQAGTSGANATSTKTVYIRVSQPHLPVKTTTVTSDSRHSSTTTLFTRWNLPVSISAPDPAIPIATTTLRQ